MEAKKSKKADIQNKNPLFLPIGLICALLLSVAMFSWSKPEVEVKILEPEQAVVDTEIIPIVREEQKQPEIPAKPLNVITDVIRIVDNNKQIEYDADFINEFDDKIQFVFKTAPRQEEAVADDEVFISVEEMPKFQGGDVNKFRSWVMGNLKYPVIAAENGIKGRVVVSFVVERDGTVSGVEILSSPDRSLADEAMRVIKESPKWNPGKQRNMAVRVRYNMPVDFRLN